MWLFWHILPYLIASFALAAHGRLKQAAHPRKEALRIGRELAEITRPLMEPKGSP
jgi:hypothetical protein